MKALAVIFLIGNVLVFGFHFNSEIRNFASATKKIPELPSGTPRLRLLTELKELPPDRADASKEDPACEQTLDQSLVEAVDLETERNDLIEASQNCVAIGPFTNVEQLENVRSWLRERTTVVQTVKETVRERRFFWVYLESTLSRNVSAGLQTSGGAKI